MNRARWLLCGLLSTATLAACYPNPDDLRGAGGMSGTGDLTCTNPSYPQACPARGSAPAGCWPASVVCSTVMDCAGNNMACTVAGEQVFCDVQQCCTPPLASGTCNIPDCGCSTGQVCAASTPATGLACFTAGTAGEGTACSNLTTCASGLGCFGGLCKPYCQTDSDCSLAPGSRHCLQTTWSATGANIAGVLVCEHVCDPSTPQAPRSTLLACPAGYGCNVTSITGITYCAPRSGTAIAGAACATDVDCAPGYYCGSANKLCVKYCSASTDCPSGSTCQYFSTPLYAGTVELGGCG